ncbi:hypothetical protein DVH05_015167 [Phytophthora capsici]|nr:hypothetical protein DVH05_006655 [Phytophthora capsici]KAG1698177.1 hypothetical protein DVH05_015167 [Phytophthora capsici]
MFTTNIRALLSLIATATLVFSTEGFQGDGTAYTLGQVSSGNCNYMSWNAVAPTNYAALNNAQWDDAASCGRCAQVSCIDPRCADQTASAIVQIVDRCPECAYGALDLSPSVFRTITGSSPSRLAIQWEFVDCPNPGTIKICTKGGSSRFWLAIQPTNTLVGVQNVRIEGQFATMLDGAYYFVSNSAITDLSAVRVTITSVNMEVVAGTYSLVPGQCTDTNEQFSTTEPTDTPAPYTPSTTEPPTKCYFRRNRH